MKDEKDIDSKFREKLENYQVTPPQHIWNNVQGQLAANRRRSRLAYLGWISAAAVILLAFMAGWYFNENNNAQKNASISKEIIQPEKTKSDINQQEEVAAIKESFDSISNDKSISKPANQFVASRVYTSEIVGESKSTNSEVKAREISSLSLLKSADAIVTQKQHPDMELAKNAKSVSVKTLSSQEELLIAENIKSMKAATKPENNWKMGMYVAPGYSSYTANHSDTYSQNMTYSDNNGNTNVSGGFSVQYKTSKRWIVESGVYYAQSGHESDNSVNLFALNKESDNMFAPGEVPYFNNTVRVENNNLAMNSTAGVIRFSSTPRGAELNGEFDASKTADANIMVPDGQFSQVFELMEIPLYIRYRIIDSKVGIELITGLNAGIVVGNNAYINNQYGLQNIGETEDISTLNLSGTLGMGVNYALGKHFSVAIEPRFNYYLNSINTNSSVNFRPYRIGFYTGVSYEF